MSQDRLSALLDFYRDDPDDPFVRYALAQEYLGRGDSEQALATFEALVAEQPDYVGTYYHLGKLYETLGRTDAAVQTYQAGIETAGRASDLHARAELQSALLEAQGIGFDDE